MKSLLFRTNSGSSLAQLPPRHTHFVSLSPKMSVLHMETPRRNIRRCFSEPNIIRSEMRTLTKLGSPSFTVDHEYDHQRSGILWEELGSSGGGMNKNGNSGGGGSGGNGSEADRNNIGAYYQEMIKSNPTNPLLLRNYAKYLHEVVGDAVKAEEYYGRAILASHGDGEVLSLYGKLIWETQRDESRARSYFTQALQASPHDCMVLGSYAHFLWEAEEEECGDEDEEMEREVKMMK